MRTVYDGEGNVVASQAGNSHPRKRWSPFPWVNLLVAAVIVAVTWLVASQFMRPHRKPFVEVTVYGAGGINAAGVLPPWNVKGTPIDGGYVYVLPAEDRAAVDEIRKVLGGMETLHEKRGKPPTYDPISLFELRTDDPAAVKRTISEFMGEGFPVRIRAVTASGLTVATLNPRGLKGKLSHVYSISEKDGNVPELTLRKK
jgi:hypothetical protein